MPISATGISTSARPLTRTGQGGFTLIEVMVAMVIGVILLLGAGSLFISNKRIYTELEATGLLQENARFAMQTMYEAIRMSGYVGCSDDPSNVTNYTGASAGDLSDLSLPIATDNWQPSDNADVPAIKAGTDAITVRYLRGINFPLEVDMSSPTDTIVLNEQAGFLTNDIVAIHDCTSTDLFRITNVTHNAGDADDPTDGTKTLTHGQTLNHAYKTAGNAVVSRYRARRYYIAEYDHDGDASTPNVPALFHSEAGGQALIDGVENMQILYGEDTTADNVADEFRAAEDVVNWSNVTSVRMAFLLRTINPDNDMEPNTNTYSLNGVAVGPFNDQYRRRVVTTTVLIRNRDI